jgi:RNA polymerase sigma factor (sigma-70 family)
MPATLTSIFLLHRRSLIWSVLRIVRDPHIAEDVAQEAYLRTRKAIERQPIEHVEAFLHQTARNLALDHQRRKRTRGEVEADGFGEREIDDIPADLPSQEDTVIERQRLQLFQEALAGLPERARTVIVLSRIEEWPNRKIAAFLGVSERTVFNDLKLAMAHCRAALARPDRS